ncbi:MAG: hypothetical protein OEZ22_09510 [Spirochaetia bacterium]|nr:hypothetical protein [Spirochaetia bacterium]
MPVRVAAINSAEIQYGPKLSIDNEKNSWDLSRLIYLYLKISYFNALVEPMKVETIFNQIKLSSQHKLTVSTLNKLNTYIDVDQMLLSQISKKGDYFEMESRIFYTYSKNLTDSLISKHKNIWKLIALHLEERFKNIKPPQIFEEHNKPIIFGLDSSGGSYYEIKNIAEALKHIEASSYTICALDGYGKLSFLPPDKNWLTASKYLKDLTVKGGSNYIENFNEITKCLSKFVKYEKTKPLTIILTSGVPKSYDEKNYIKNFFRDYAKLSDLLILGTGKLNETDKDFWQSAADEFTRHGYSAYQDIIYSQKIGLKTGETWYIYKKGFKIFESKDSYLSKDDKAISVPVYKRNEYTPSNLLTVYEFLSKNQVINHSSININIPNQIFEIMKPLSYNNENNIIENVRLLIEVEKIPIWINMPKSQVYKDYTNLLINENEYYYFIINLEKGKKGMPVVNSKNIGFIFNEKNNLPDSLIINMKDFLKNPDSYLNNSIDGSSIYILLGKLKKVRLKEYDVFE